MSKLDASTDLVPAIALGLTIRESVYMLHRPMAWLYEAWQDEGGIDAMTWGTAVAGGGVVARDTLEAPYLKAIISGAAPLSTARLYGLQRWYCAPEPVAVNFLQTYPVQKTNLEFVAHFIFPANFDNTLFFMGFGFAQNVDETSPNIIGFTMDGANNLQATTVDLVGATVQPFMPIADIVNWTKYRIEVEMGGVNFYANDVVIAASDNFMPNYSMYPVFFVPQANVPGAAMLEVAMVRIWNEQLD